jgi:AcrR family transcriptional regulator
MDNHSVASKTMVHCVDVKESILHAGVRLLKKHGIAALTQPKVAMAAGIKQSHLTYYFPRRTDLLLGIAEHTIEGVMSNLSARMEGELPQAALAETMATMMIDGIPPRVMIGLIVAADADPALRPPLRKLIKHIRARIGRILDKAGAATCENSSLLFHATMVGLAVMHDARRTSESAREIREGINGMLRLLAPEAAKNSQENIQ